MIHLYEKFYHFGIDNKKFLNDTPYFSVSRIGTLINEKREIGPFECGGLDYDKRRAIKKGFSESIERRALMVGGRSVNDTTAIQAFDLIKKEKVLIPSELSKYHHEHPIIDTSGTAAHTDSQQALRKSLFELLEKNASFLFWYGQKGKLLKMNTALSTYSRGLFGTQDVFLFLIDAFAPLHIIITMLKEETVLHYSFGVGSSFCIEDACEKSLLECFHLTDFYKIEKIKAMKKLGNSERLQDEKHHTKLWIDTLLNKGSISVEGLDNEDIEIHSFINQLPSWIEHLYIMCLKQQVSKRHIILKTYSPQLYSHIPKKSYFDLNIEINKQLTKLNPIDLQFIPDCLIM